MGGARNFWFAILTALGELSFGARAHATDQALDQIRYNGQIRLMMECPMQSKWPKAESKELTSRLTSNTSNWKGYYAGWELKDSRLFLTSLMGDNKAELADSVFPGQKLPIFADWFSGEIQIPYGNLEGGSGSFYRREFEKVVVLTIDKGKHTKTEEFKNAKVKDHFRELLQTLEKEKLEKEKRTKE
ncbi:MAG: hypothetical protein ACJ8C4_01105 [Gemmataceae bacterium]